MGDSQRRARQIEPYTNNFSRERTKYGVSRDIYRADAEVRAMLRRMTFRGI